MTHKGSYQDAGATGAAHEAARLQAQARAIFAREDALLRAAGVADGGTLLDVGCGPGHWLAQVRSSHRARLALGVERDVDHARVAAAQGPVVRADAAALPLTDGAVDAVTMRLVLRHLPAPTAALAEMVRVVRPGGVVCVLDADDGALTLHEPPATFAPLWDALTATARRRGANPHVGRALWALLNQAGLRDVRVTPLPVTTQDLAAPAFVELLLAPQARPVDADLMAPADVAAAWAALRAWAAAPGAFGMAMGMVATGTRPA